MSRYQSRSNEHDDPSRVGDRADDGPRKRDDRDSLRDARYQRVRPEELWRALVEGRWSLVDRYDADGRRYYVAWRNPERVTREVALTEIEERILMRAAAGEPNKVIAYELDLAYSTVAAYASRACRKLGFTGRMELIQLTRALDLDFSSALEDDSPALAG